MKNKIAKKLFFSAVALGASVLTLTTTTYAWYVQNNTVTATDIVANTASNSAGSLFISKDARPDDQRPKDNNDNPVPISWGPKIEITDEDYGTVGAAIGNVKNAFIPVSYVPATQTESAKFVDASNAVPAEGKVLTFNFFLLSNKQSGVTVQPTLTVQNTTQQSNKVAQTAYAAVKNNATPQTNLVNEGEQFWVDAVQALKMKVSMAKWNQGTGAWESTLADQFYDVLDIAKKPKAQSSDQFATYELTSYGDANVIDVNASLLGSETIDSQSYEGAHAYYRRFVGGEPAAGFTSLYSLTTQTTAHEMNKFGVNDVPTRYTFTIWLDGTDTACFDSCSGQTFKFGFDFTVSTSTPQQNP